MRLGLTAVASVFLLAPSVLAGGLRYRITDSSGERIPAKLTFTTNDGRERVPVDVKSKAPYWAARPGAVYTLPGDEPLPVPEGSYRIVVSRGPEHTIAVRELTVGPGEPALLEAVLERVVDTRGYLSGDMHLHTLTHSGHGDTNMEERIITLCAEHLEWAVATDHNYITDYRPTVEALHAGKWIQTTVGNEVTTTAIGHFNAFPCDPEEPPVNWRISDPRELFRRIRAEGASVIQVNHPRWTGVRGAYFRDLDLSPHTGDTPVSIFSWDFDSFEVLNDGPLSGWNYCPDMGTGSHPAFDSSVREDWYHLLNQGRAFTAVGNSDSHNVDAVIGGYPRNYIRAVTDDPPLAKEGDLIAQVKAGTVTVSSGIFVEATVGGHFPGAAVIPAGVAGGAADVAITIRVQAAPWIRADRLVVVANGEEIAVTPLPWPATGAVRHQGIFRDRPARDTWYVVYAVGDEAPVPVLHPHTFPLGFTNAFRVDADGDGKFTPLREHARRLVARIERGEEPPEALLRETPSFRRQAAGALRELPAGGASGRTSLLAALIRDRDRTVRAAAASILAEGRDPPGIAVLLGARAGAADAAERDGIDFQLARAGWLPALDDLAYHYREEVGLRRWMLRRDLFELARRREVREWEVAGPYGPKEWREALAESFPPEGVSGRVAWRPSTPDKACYLNFRDTFRMEAPSVAYARVRVRASSAARAYLLAGTENAVSILLNGTELLRRPPGGDGEAGSEVVCAAFAPGENQILVKCVPGSKDDGWGFYFHAIDVAGALEFGD